jgi:hypothetical protein
MNATLFLNDEIAQARLLLQNPARAEAMVREPETAAGCNCDRWGHPYPVCADYRAEKKADAPTKSATHK